MNLKLHLLVRMTVAGLLCWLGVSIYVVSQSGHRAARELDATADQLQILVAADVMRRWISIKAKLGVDSDNRAHAPGALVGLDPAPPEARERDAMIEAIYEIDAKYALAAIAVAG